MKSIIKTALKRLLKRGIGSQFGEDALLGKILPAHGFYVDVGVYHPHLYSNTYALYKKGWSGIAIEGEERSPITNFLIDTGYRLYAVTEMTLIFTL